MAVATDKRSSTASVFLGVALFAFAFAAFDPYVSLLFSPILLGAPHALSDIWYLLVRDSGVPMRVRWALAGGSFLLIVFALLVLFGAGLKPIVESVLIVALVSLPLALSNPKANSWPLWLIAGGISYVLVLTDFPLRAVVAHMHNVIALVFLLALALPVWGKRRVGMVVAAIVALLAVGVTLSLINNGVFTRPGDSKIWSPFLSLTFGLKGGAAGALLYSYALLQLLHFAVWIGFIPALKGDLSWKKVGRAFGFGLPILGMGIVILAVAAAPIAAIKISPLNARQAYLTLVTFHGWMEIGWLLAHASRLLSANAFTLRETFLFEGAQAA